MVRPLRLLVIVVAAMSVIAIGLALPAANVLAQGQAGGPGGQGAIGPSATTQSATATNQNDAGSGQDAGDSIESALTIQNAQRTWSANLTPAGTDSDWYVMSSSGAFCAVASVTTQAPGSVALTGSGSLEAAARRPVDAHHTTRVAIAAPGGSMPKLGILPPSTMSMPAEGGGGPPTPGRYTFGFTARSHAQLDPEGDGDVPDAGSTAATSASLPADCAAGRIGSADAEDRYHFDVTSVRDLTFSFAVASGDPAELRIVSPSGATFATIQSGGIADVWADEPGRWTAVVSYPAAPTGLLALAGFGQSMASDAFLTDYIVGVTDGPDPEPCRPSCFG